MIATGMPGCMPPSDHETVAASAASATGQYLGPLLERASVKPIIEDVPVKRVKRSRKVSIDEPELMSAK